MLEIGAIRELSSPRSSNMLSVRKKGGIIRFSIYFCKLNQRTIKDAFLV